MADAAFFVDGVVSIFSSRSQCVTPSIWAGAAPGSSPSPCAGVAQNPKTVQERRGQPGDGVETSSSASDRASIAQRSSMSALMDSRPFVSLQRPAQHTVESTPRVDATSWVSSRRLPPDCRRAALVPILQLMLKRLEGGEGLVSELRRAV